MNPVGRIDVEAVRITLGPQDFEAVRDLDFSVAPGEFVCLLGPSGCGKSTLLNALAGHVAIRSGALRVDGVLVAGPHPDRGVVFQQPTLFPWKTVLDNVAFGPKMKGVAKAERRRLAAEMLEQVGLAGFGAHYPAQLSGGMRQRVEWARVLINHPRVLLMDEPFSALDAQTRLTMQELLLDLWGRIGSTVLFVTHDIDEALFLGDRILVMGVRPGRIIEEMRVPFGRPRRMALVTEPEFARYKRRCLALLRSGVAADISPLVLAAVT
jgi:NitT/TauT family transport system ATP-binding protein